MIARREIGSEFWDIPVCDHKCSVWNKNTQWYLSGRSALQAVIKDIRKQKTIKSVMIPSWSCQTVIKPFTDAGIAVYFYPVYYNGSRLVQELSRDCDAILLMDYFGYADSEYNAAYNLKNYKGFIIRDVTHSIFVKSYHDADYYFGSLRKWCGVWTGGYAWTSDGHSLGYGGKGMADDGDYVYLRKKAMQLKYLYIQGFSDENGKTVSDKAYLDIYGRAEELLDTCGILPASDRDIKLAEYLDIEFIRSRRKANAKTLTDRLCSGPDDNLPYMLMFRKLSEKDCPMFVPLLLLDGKRDKLRQYLIQHDVYCPVHWPLSKYHRVDGRGHFIYGQELSLVCDQRYDTKDMKLIAGLIKNFYRK